MKYTSKHEPSVSDPNFEKLIPPSRPLESVHPLSTETLRNQNKKLRKATFPEEMFELSYSELAWEFLRRNRFYKALVDGRKKALPVSEWGYCWDCRVSRTHGLIRLKPYWETYFDGEPPAWQGLQDFTDQLPTSVSMEPKTLSIALQPGQVAIVFDVGGIIGGQSPYDIQIVATMDRLKVLCEKEFGTTAIAGKPQHKNVLIQRLKIFDLIDEKGLTVAGAASDLRYKAKGTAAMLKGKLNPFRGIGKLETSSTAFDHVNEAYRLVYRHGYIDLLRGDKSHMLKGNRLIPAEIFFRDAVE